MASNIDGGQKDEIRFQPSNSGDDVDMEFGEPGESHEFDIIDELVSEEEEGEAKDSKEGSEKEAGEIEDEKVYSDISDIEDSELHALLEKDVTKDSITAPAEKKDGIEGEPEVREKILLKGLLYYFIFLLEIANTYYFNIEKQISEKKIVFFFFAFNFNLFFLHI